MKRRRFLVGSLATLIAVPSALSSQPADDLPRVAFVVQAEDTANLTVDHPTYGPFFRDMQTLGYVEGRTIKIERWSALAQDPDFIERMAHTVVDSRPDVIVVRGRRLIEPFAAATDSIPIVGVGTFPPEYQGNLAKPGGNVTGFSLSAGDAIYTKRLQLLRDAVPYASRIAWIGPRDNWEGTFGDNTRKAAQELGIEQMAAIVEYPVGEATIRRAFADLKRLNADALVVSNATVMRNHLELVAELTVASKLPAMSSLREFAEQGIMMSYDTSAAALHGKSAHYVDQILKGAVPGNLPIQNPTEFDLVINLKTARALGIEIPPKLLIPATELIE